MRVNAILLKPLDGYAVGSPRQLERGDFDRLHAMGAVREASSDDAVEPEPDNAALLIEQLRHPIEGPRILADMKTSFESLGRENQRLSEALDASEQLARDNGAARDAAIVDRDAARVALTAAESARGSALAAAGDPVREQDTSATTVAEDVTASSRTGKPKPTA